MRSSLREGRGDLRASGSLINGCQNTFETGGDGREWREEGRGSRGGRGGFKSNRAAENWETLNLFYCHYFVQLSKGGGLRQLYNLVNTKNADDAHFGNRRAHCSLQLA